MDTDTCPRCGQHMERGAIYSGRWIRWLPQGERAPLAWGQFRHVALQKPNWFAFKTPTSAAQRCVHCRIVLFSY